MKNLLRAALVVLGLTTTFAAPAAAGQLEDGITATNQKDYATALMLLRPLAEQGDSVAQTYLGSMYGNGNGVPQDYTEAIKWYRKAADQGNAKAQNALGDIYGLGRGVAIDVGEAVHWYRKAVEQGNFDSQIDLIWALATTTNSSVRNTPEALRWAERAVLQNGTKFNRIALAVAYASAGRFADAVAAQQKANAMAKKDGSYGQIHDDLLRLFQQGKAVSCPGGPGC